MSPDKIGIILLVAVTLALAALVWLCEISLGRNPPGVGLVQRLVPSLVGAPERSRQPLPLALAVLASSPQAYLRVPHAMGWVKVLSENHRNCLELCSRSVETYCLKSPGIEAGRILYPRLDSEKPAGQLDAAQAFRCSSGQDRLACHYACLCDKSDEICPNGYHLQVTPFPPQVLHYFPQAEWDWESELLSSDEALEMIGDPAWERGFRGTVALFGLKGSGRLNYYYRLS